jgi:tRNA A37 N6-isopentenylltransferase MiaA
MADRFDFIIGVTVGILVGGLGLYVMVKIRGWFSSSEVRRLRQENRQMQKRLEQKDRHIDEMLRRAEEVAQEMQHGRTRDDGS